ncbi:MAG: hypothetical protein ACRC62_21715 [Microcoleus sp.]
MIPVLSNSQLLTINCQSIASGDARTTTINYQLSTLNSQLSTFNSQLIYYGIQLLLQRQYRSH